MLKEITISIPEYTIHSMPDYAAVGAKIDKALAENFEGAFLVRALSGSDHPKLTLDEFTEIIRRTGTDKYDPDRKGVDHEVFEVYKPDLQAGQIMIQNGRILGESFAEDVRRFYENTIFDRGCRLRIDLLVLYDPREMIRAEKLDRTKPGVEPHLEQYLWRFRDPQAKASAVAGLVKILR